jgi:hypothetical protein
MSGFVTYFAAVVAVLFVLPGVAEGEYITGLVGTNWCPYGSEQVPSWVACQEASGDLGYPYYSNYQDCKPRGCEEKGADGGSRGGEEMGGFEGRSGECRSGH